MRTEKQKIQDGLYGLLIGDALGVPYEFHPPNEIPPQEQIEFVPPENFRRSYPGIPPGTWSDDGAQALCLLDSLLIQGELDLYDFGGLLVQWLERGFWAVDNKVFDCGVQTMSSLQAFINGESPELSGFIVPQGKGNGALMRVLPLALWHRDEDKALVEDAHKQALITHGHVCNQVCCALYCLWARYLLAGASAEQGYHQAVRFLEQNYTDEEYRYELECCTAAGTPGGTGYVVDSIRSAKHLLFTCTSYEDVVKGAVALGNDTDTTAAIAGGLAGIAFGDIPNRWMAALRDREKVQELLSRLLSESAL